MLGFVALIISISSQHGFMVPAIRESEAYLYANQLDITTDDSITRYVGPKDSLTTLRYKPTDLVDLNEAGFAKVQGGIGHLRKEAFVHLADMAYHFFKVFHKELYIVSSYRSYGLQESLFSAYTLENGSAAAGFSALPGHSEHQLGLAVDLFTANDVDAAGYKGYYDWLRKNAHKRGFVQSYQRGRSVDGYIVEPWHWRYLGVRLATELYIHDMTFAEWVNKYDKVSLRSENFYE